MYMGSQSKTYKVCSKCLPSTSIPSPSFPSPRSPSLLVKTNAKLYPSIVSFKNVSKYTYVFPPCLHSPYKVIYYT